MSWPPFELDGEHIAITSLYSGKKAHTSGHIYVSCGVYEGRVYTGKSYSGEVSEKELVRWLIEQGYLVERDW